MISQAELVKNAIARKVISFPTDTVPALAVKPDNAVMLYRVKQRPETKPLILMGASWDDLVPYIQGTKKELERWSAIAKNYFPGAITFVLPASSLVPPGMNPTNSQTIGVRVPDSDIARDILRQTGALATTSANISGEATLTTTAKIEAVFPDLAILEDSQPNVAKGSCLPSTVVQWKDGDWQLLRQGSVNFEVTL